MTSDICSYIAVGTFCTPYRTLSIWMDRFLACSLLQMLYDHSFPLFATGFPAPATDPGDASWIQDLSFYKEFDPIELFGSFRYSISLTGDPWSFPNLIGFSLVFLTVTLLPVSGFPFLRTRSPAIFIAFCFIDRAFDSLAS